MEDCPFFPKYPLKRLIERAWVQQHVRISRLTDTTLLPASSDWRSSTVGKEGSLCFLSLSVSVWLTDWLTRDPCTGVHGPPTPWAWRRQPGPAPGAAAWPSSSWSSSYGHSWSSWGEKPAWEKKQEDHGTFPTLPKAWRCEELSPHRTTLLDLVQLVGLPSVHHLSMSMFSCCCCIFHCHFYLAFAYKKRRI